MCWPAHLQVWFTCSADDDSAGNGDGVKNYRFWLAAAFVAYIFVDLARRFFEGTKALLVVFDLGLLAAYVAYFTSQRESFRRSLRGQVFFVAMCLYALLVVVECANPSPYARYAVTKVLALRNYLSALPAVWLGYDLASRAGRRSLLKLGHWFQWLFIIVAMFGIVAYFIRGGSTQDTDAVLKPLAGAVRSYEQGQLTLSSSFFATSVRFAFFLLGGYLILWAHCKETGRQLWPIALIAAAGFYVSGSRALLTMFLIFLGLSTVFFRASKGQLSRRFVATALATGAVIAVGMLFSADISRALAGEDHRTRAAYMIQGRTEYLERSQMAFSPLYLRPDNPDIVFGIGVGTFGQETFAVPALNRSSYRFVTRFFYEEPGMPLADSGLTKICIESGVVGLVIMTFFFLTVMWISAGCILRSAVNRDAFGFAMAFYPLAWIMIFLKGHQVLGGLETTTFLFLCTGFVLHSLERQEPSSFSAPVPSAT